MTETKQAELYAAWRDKVFSYIIGKVESREDAEDLCSQVFEKVYRALAGYDETKASLSTWIYTITRNTLTDYYRTLHVTEPISENIRAPDDVEEQYIKEETLTHLASLLKVMKQPERDVIILRYYKGYSLAYISKVTGWGYGAVKAAHRRALNMLRLALDST